MWTRMEKIMLLIVIMGAGAPGENEIILALTGIVGITFFLYQSYYYFNGK